MYRARLGGVEGLEHLVRERGENPIALMAQVGLTPAQFRDPNQYIAYSKLAALLDVCSTACKEPRFGLVLARRQRAEVLGVLPLLASRADTLGDALSVADRYLHLHASGVRLTTVVRADTARAVLRIGIGQPPGKAQRLQFSVVQLALFTGALLNRDAFAMPIHLRQKALSAAAPAAPIRFRRLRFGQEFDGVSLPARSLSRPCHRDEAAITRQLEDYLARLQALYPNRLEDQRADIIGRLLPTEECSLEELAATLNLRPRTLQGAAGIALAVCVIAVSNQIARSSITRKRFDDLLSCRLCCGMFCHR